MDHSNSSWSTLSKYRNLSEILYEDQISAALKVEDIPLRISWTNEMWTKILDSITINESIGPIAYPGCEADVTLAIWRWLPKQAVAVVIGSVSPWIEAILYSHGCQDIYTLDIDKINSEVECLKTVSYKEWNQLGIKADLIISFSTVEHIGLGRYGDQEDQEGDIKWINEFAFNNLKSDGIQLLAVPIGGFDLINNSHHRIYGPKRMDKMLEYWDL